MPACGERKPLLYGMEAVCDRATGHDDEVTVPGRNGPEPVPADQHYDSKIVGSWPVEDQ